MRIILSPAKNMIFDDSLGYSDLPVYLTKSYKLLNYLQSLSYEELKELWKCNDKLVLLNQERIRMMNLKQALSPAVLSYDGLVFKHMAPQIFSTGAFDYIQKHLRILSAFYGVLKPLDGICLYRLEMQSRAGINDTKSLYDYWDDLIYREVIDKDHLIINLASKEYSKCVENYLQENDHMIHIVFGEYKEGKIITKATKAKMARGAMVRFMAENRIADKEDIKKFNDYHYLFDDSLSTESLYYFIENKE